MRELRIFGVKKLLFGLLTVFAIECFAQEFSESRATVFTKNAMVQIRLENATIVMDITREDGRRMTSHIFTEKKSKSNEQLLIDSSCGRNTICIRRGESLKVETTIKTSPNEETIEISTESNENTRRETHCYSLGDDREWYGGPQVKTQYWPIQNMFYKQEPYLPTHQKNMGIAERYWLTSDGFWIFVNETVPLFIDQNIYYPGFLCLISETSPPYRAREIFWLNYTIGFFGNPKAAHNYVVNRFMEKPNGHPDERMIKHPIWSTWARYKVNVNESIVNAFANEILSHGFNNSQLEIDDNWETCYGSAIFDPRKFPNVTRMTEALKKKGFRVTLWIHPFINEGCEPAYSQALNSNYFVKNVDGQVRMSWWQGIRAATIDFTNPKAVNWWVARLRLILKSGIDGFKFDAGEVSWLPQVAALTGSLDLQPGLFTTNYVTTLSKNFGDIIEVRVGWRTQKLSMFVRMLDKDTNWSWNNGLPTLISTLLQMNLNGYVHVLPDMIGGNGYLDNSFNGTVYPSKELFIRWLQANVFMPALQYSFVPWDYDAETVAIAKLYTDIHAGITPYILQRMNISVTTGAPLNPPVWWIAPKDPIAHKINDAFLLGDQILVAPVTKEGAIKRDVYLPAGRWVDPNRNFTVHTGPIWLLDYPAPLQILPWFIKEVGGSFAL